MPFDSRVMSLSFPSYQQQPSNTPLSSARPQILHQENHVAISRIPRNSQPPSSSYSSHYLLPLQASSSLPRYSEAALCSGPQPLHKLTGEATYSKRSIPVSQLLTQVSIPPTSAVHLLVCMKYPSVYLSPASRVLPTCLKPHLPTCRLHPPTCRHPHFLLVSPACKHHASASRHHSLYLLVPIYLLCILLLCFRHHPPTCQLYPLLASHI